MSRGGEESPLHWSETNWEHWVGQSACWLWAYRVRKGLQNFMVLSSVLSKVLTTFKLAVQHRAVRSRVSQDILILAWLWRQCEGWCPLSILADTGQTKELFVLVQSHFLMSASSQCALRGHD